MQIADNEYQNLRRINPNLPVKSKRIIKELMEEHELEIEDDKITEEFLIGFQTAIEVCYDIMRGENR